MATVRVSRLVLTAGPTLGSSATVRVGGMRLLTGTPATITPVTVRVGRMQIITGSPQVSNIQLYRWNGSTLRPVSAGRWTGSDVEMLTS